jgi:hypothetical protein
MKPFTLLRGRLQVQVLSGSPFLLFIQILGQTIAKFFEHPRMFGQMLTKAQIIFEISKPDHKR